MTLEKATKVSSGLTALEYEVSHSTPGREGTTLTCPLRMQIQHHGGPCIVKLDLCEAQGATPKEALEKLVSYLQRMTEGIEKRRETWVPI